jgi:hypothetical protein
VTIAILGGSPRLLEGSLRELDSLEPPTGIVVFRCNLDTPRLKPTVQIDSLSNGSKS